MDRDLKMTVYSNDMDKDVTQDLQMKPVDVLIAKRDTQINYKTDLDK